MQPINTRETITEPASEDSANEAIQIPKDMDSFGNNPCNSPTRHAETDPNTNRALIALVQEVGLQIRANAGVGISKASVAIDDTGADNSWDSDSKAILLIRGPAELKAGDVTSLLI
jgi:hypothetical protein